MRKATAVAEPTPETPVGTIVEAEGQDDEKTVVGAKTRRGKKPPEPPDTHINILELEYGEVVLYILGTSPLIMNRLAEKARQELLLPAPKKNQAERQMTLKHDPIAEFRSSVYRGIDGRSPTRLHMPRGAFKKAMATAALDIPGATKAQIGRLTSIASVNISIYGKPEVYTCIVRQAGINRAPDVRTRAIIPEWCAKLTVRYVRTLITEKQVCNLVSAAGMIVGVGDNRTEKGADDFGSFRVVGYDNPDFARIVKSGGMKEQDHALEHPVCFDADTEDLLAWFETEVIRREKDVPSSGKRAKRGKKQSVEGLARTLSRGAKKKPGRRGNGARTLQ